MINATITKGAESMFVSDRGDDIEVTVISPGQVATRIIPRTLLAEAVSAFEKGVGVNAAGALACLAYLDYVRDMNEHPVESLTES